MPTKHKQRNLTLTAEEDETFRREAAEAKTSVSNLLRRKLGLSEIKRGATEKNKRNPFGRSGKPSDG